jgi:hypothetical protein
MQFLQREGNKHQDYKKKMRENATTRGLTVELVGFWT